MGVCREPSGLGRPLTALSQELLERTVAKNLSTFAIAEMLHVDPGSVANWIDQKLLKAYRTPGDIGGCWQRTW